MMGKPGWYACFFVSAVLIAFTDRSFVLAWQTSMRIHELMAENRVRFAQRLNEMSDELNNLAKEVDKNRKQVESIQFFLFSKTSYLLPDEGTSLTIRTRPAGVRRKH
jgi:hypothetical protein